MDTIDFLISRILWLFPIGGSLIVGVSIFRIIFNLTNIENEKTKIINSIIAIILSVALYSIKEMIEFYYS